VEEVWKMCSRVGPSGGSEVKGADRGKSEVGEEGS
jgi:hypothetical protein